MVLENHAIDHALARDAGQSAGPEAAREFRVTLEGGRSFLCRDGEGVLWAMERQGLRDVVVGCRGGGCGVCRVRVTQGRYRVGKISRAHVSEAELAQGIVLACRLYPETDIEMITSVPPGGAAKDR